MLDFIKGKLFNAQFVRILGQVNYQAADLSECFSVREHLNTDDFNSWYIQWSKLAETLYKEAQTLAEKGQKVSAKNAFLRASTYFRGAYFFLEDHPSDTKIEYLLSRSIETFQQSLSLSDYNVQLVEMPYQDIYLPGYLFLQKEKAPILISCAGGDGTKEEAFSIAQEAYLRGFHALVFEGPGQGSVLRLQGVPFTPNWHRVLSSVIDYLEKNPLIDQTNIIYYGKSFGGYLAAQAATKEKRLKALILDPAQYSMLDNLKNSFLKDIQSSKPLSQIIETALINADVNTKFMFNSRLWRFGVNSYQAFCDLLEDYEILDQIKYIDCPVMVFDNEEEYLSKGQAKVFYEKLTAEKHYYQFKANEMTGGHCQPLTPSIFFQKLFSFLNFI